LANDLLDSLLSKLSPYIHKESDIALISKAFYYALEAHGDQRRKSGEPYIIHPIAVAIILTTLRVGPSAIIAAILHDVVEDTLITLQDIKKEFNEDISSLIDGVTKISRISYNDDNNSENHQKLLIAMAKDIRVIIIKIADRLHNMRTLQFMEEEKRIRISKETLEIYAPLAHRLGLFRIKGELEDLSLFYTNPSMYEKIKSLVEITRQKRDSNINFIIERIRHLFEENKMVDFEIKGRIKNIYSIYKKMVVNNKDFEDIYDLLAIRVIVSRVEDCYHVLGLIHANFSPIPKRFKDYIAVPKPNMYQSLHTTVLSDDETLFEVQIRTREMDDVAENGIAAHWAYKEDKVYNKEKEQFEIASALRWYGELLKFSEEDGANESALEFVDTIKTDILDANVYVYTPKGLIVELPKGSTPLDLAYKIHTDVGNKTVGAIVNNHIVPLDYELKTGDIVNIKTNKNSLGPSEDWLKIVKSQHARHKIKAFLNDLNHDYLVEKGKNEYLEEAAAQKISEVLTNELVAKFFSKNNLNTTVELFYEIGKGILSPKTAVNIIYGTTQSVSALSKQMEKATRALITNSETGVYIEGLTNPLIKLASCCNPIPGDGIIGYVTKNQGIVVHGDYCRNIDILDKKRFVETYWATNITRKFATWLKLICTNRVSLLPEIINSINSQGVMIAEFQSINSFLETVIKMKISLQNKSQLDTLIVNLRKIKDIHLVEREIK
jgi:GTP pyrophosphokinase